MGTEVRLFMVVQHLPTLSKLHNIYGETLHLVVCKILKVTKW